MTSAFIMYLYSIYLVLCSSSFLSGGEYNGYVQRCLGLFSRAIVVHANTNHVV